MQETYLTRAGSAPDQDLLGVLRGPQRSKHVGLSNLRLEMCSSKRLSDYLEGSIAVFEGQNMLSIEENMVAIQ